MSSNSRSPVLMDNPVTNKLFPGFMFSSSLMHFNLLYVKSKCLSLINNCYILTLYLVTWTYEEIWNESGLADYVYHRAYFHDDHDYFYHHDLADSLSCINASSF